MEGRNAWQYIVATIILAGVIFVLDIMTPTGIAISVLYAPVMLLAIWRLEGVWIISIGILSSLFIGADFLLSKQSTEFYPDIFNPLLAMIATWCIAIGLPFRNHHQRQLSTLQADINTLRTLLAATSNAVLAVDEQGLICFANPRCQELFGYSPGELNYQPVELLVPHKTRAQHLHLRQNYLAAPMQRAMGAGRELYAQRKDGSQFPVEVGLKPIDLGGKQLVLTEVIDISIRKQLQNQMEQRERQLRLITDSLPMLIAHIDKKKRYNFVNATYAKWLSKTPEQIIGQFKQSVLSEAMYAYLLPYIERALAGETVKFIAELIFPDGQQITGEVLYLPDIDANGQVKGYFSLTQDMSERLKTETEIRRLAAIVTTSQDGILSTDTAGTIVSWNTGAETLYGYSASEMLGQSIKPLIPSGYETETQELRSRALQGEKIVNFETKRLTKNGKLVDISVSFSPLYDAHGEISGVASISRDITARKRAEQRFRRVVEAAPSAMVMVDQQGRIELVNKLTEKLFGYSRQELLGKKVEILIPKRLRAQHPQHRENFLANPKERLMGVGRELFAERKDGSEFPVEIGLNPVESDEGMQILASVVDITERKRAEELFRQAVESAPNAMIMTDSKDKILLANHAVEHTFGYSEAALLGEHITVLIPPAEREQHPLSNPALTTMNDIDGLPRQRRVYHCQHQDGRQIPVEIARNSITTVDGNMWLFALVDISDRIQLEHAMLQHNNELERSNRELDDFAYIVSHDLKEPLRGINTFATFLKEDYAERLDNDGREMLDTLVRLPQRLEGLIDALLYYSRVGRSQLSPQAVDFNVLVDDVRDSLQVFLAEKNAEIRIPEPLPVLHCDAARMNEVFTNLITNAVKYNEQVSKWIEIGYQRETALPTLYVRDNGIGIKPEHHESVFRIFKRLHSRDAYGGGTGAGLTFVKRIIEQHGGRIWIESDYGQGTTFFFTLSSGDSENA